MSGGTVAEISMTDSSKPSNEALAFSSPCNLTAAEMIPRDAEDSNAPTIPTQMEVLHDGLTSDHTVGLDEEHPPQLDPISDSQPLTSIIEGQNTECDSFISDMEASTSAQSVPTLQEVSGQIEIPSTSKHESVGAVVEELKASKGVGNGKSSILVARASETLEIVLRDCNLYHLSLLTEFRRATNSDFKATNSFISMFQGPNGQDCFSS